MMRMAYQLDQTRIAGSNARAEAARQKLSGREIARRLGLTPVYVNRRLSGEIEFSETDIRRFADVLDIPAASLLTEGDR